MAQQAHDGGMAGRGGPRQGSGPMHALKVYRRTALQQELNNFSVPLHAREHEHGDAASISERWLECFINSPTAIKPRSHCTHVTAFGC